MNLKKIFAIGLCAALVPLRAAAIELSAEAAICMDMDSGRVLYACNENQPMQIASTTKIMTALIVLENCQLDEKIVIPAEAVGVEGSSLYLVEGESMTVQDLLYGMMLRSGNDAAVALAIHCGGDIDSFVNMMNQKAKSLGLDHCHFCNPHGLSQQGHLCSAGDLAVIAAEAMNDPDFTAIVSTKSYTFGSRTVVNHNRLLKYYDGAVGVKTGYTMAAGRTLVGAARKNGQTLITVTLNDPNDWADHAALFDYCFETYPLTQLVVSGQVMARLPVAGSREDTVTVVAEEDFYYPVSADEQTQIRLKLPDFLLAPVSQGQNVGSAEICVDGTIVGQVLLTAGHHVSAKEPEDKPSVIERIIGSLQ